MSEATVAYVGLGSNLGDKRAYLTEAISGLAEIAEVVRVSSLYETDPVGGPADQDVFYNVVVEISCTCGPYDLLSHLHELEQRAQRVRTVRFGPRTLDADVLLFGSWTSTDDTLTVPHPRMYERRFVLAPLREIAPDLVSEKMLERTSGEVRLLGTL